MGYFYLTEQRSDQGFRLTSGLTEQRSDRGFRPIFGFFFRGAITGQNNFRGSHLAPLGGGGGVLLEEPQHTSRTVGSVRPFALASTRCGESVRAGCGEWTICPEERSKPQKTFPPGESSVDHEFPISSRARIIEKIMDMSPIRR